MEGRVTGSFPCILITGMSLPLYSLLFLLHATHISESVGQIVFCKDAVKFTCCVQSLQAEPSSSELSSDMERLLQLNDEDDDASSIARIPSPLVHHQPLEAAGTPTSQKVKALLANTYMQLNMVLVRPSSVWFYETLNPVEVPSSFWILCLTLPAPKLGYHD